MGLKQEKKRKIKFTAIMTHEEMDTLMDTILTRRKLKFHGAKTDRDGKNLCVLLLGDSEIFPYAVTTNSLNSRESIERWMNRKLDALCFRTNLHDAILDPIYRRHKGIKEAQVSADDPHKPGPEAPRGHSRKLQSDAA
jgi:hypothetical protein